MNSKEKYGDSFKKGRIVEQEYCDIFGSKLSTPEEDYKYHFDTVISIEQAAKKGWIIKNPVKVDVKSLKKVARTLIHTEEIYHWIEVKNVKGGLGSAFAGQSDFLAFETIDYFIHVSKSKIKEFCKEKIIDREIYPMPKADLRKLYTMYRREEHDRKDAIAIVKTIDLMRYSDFIVNKTK